MSKPQTNRLSARLRVAAAVAAVAASIALVPGAGAQSPAKPVQINYVGFTGGPINLIEHVAIDKGMFAARGLDVKFIGVTNSQQFAAALVGGSAQIGLMIASASVPLAAQGQCFTYLSADARHFYNLVAQPDLALPNASRPFPQNLVDLKGKKIGIVSRGGGMEFMLNAVLREAGMNPAEVTYVATGGAATAVAAFKAKQVDVAMTFPPQEQMMKPEEYKRVAKLTDAREHNPIHGLTQGFSGATCEYAKTNPRTIESFCLAVGDAYKYVNNPTNRREVIGVVQKVMGIDQSTAAAFWDQYSTTWPTPKIDRAAWDQQKIILPADAQLPPYEEAVSASCQSKF